MLSTVLFPSLALAAGPRTGPEAAAEQDFLARANASRGGSGLGALAPSGAWQEPARSHSDDMAASGSIFHDSNLSGEASAIGCWRKIGENVGMGPSVDAIHSALMNSPTHRANLLGEYDAVGMGVKVAPSGYLFVTQRFMKGCGGPAPAPAPAPVVQPVQPAPQPVVAKPAPVLPAPKPVPTPPKIAPVVAPAPPAPPPAPPKPQYLFVRKCVLSWSSGVYCTAGKP